MRKVYNKIRKIKVYATSKWDEPLTITGTDLTMKDMGQYMVIRDCGQIKVHVRVDKAALIIHSETG